MNVSRVRNVERASSVTDDLIGDPPGWLTQWGSVLVTAVLAMVVGLTAFIRYPDVISAPATLVGVDPPVAVVTRATGRIVELAVHDQQEVLLGQSLAVLESTAAVEDVRSVERLLAELQLREPADSLSKLDVELRWRGGPMSQELATLRQSLSALRTFVETQTFGVRIAALEQKRNGYDELAKVLEQRRSITESAAQLVAGQRDRNERAHAAGVATRSEVEGSEERVLDKQSAANELLATRIQNKVAAREVLSNIAALVQELADRRAAHVRDVRASEQRLRALLAEWDRTYVLRAPTSGQISFFDIWTQNQVVREGQEVFFVVPKTSAVIGRVSSGQRGIGRVKPGMDVQVELEGYPSAQFGLLRARFDKVSATDRETTGKETGYTISLVFPEGMRTTYGRQIALRQGMTGNASIVVEELSLLTRMMFPIRQLLTGGATSS